MSANTERKTLKDRIMDSVSNETTNEDNDNDTFLFLQELHISNQILIRLYGPTGNNNGFLASYENISVSRYFMYYMISGLFLKLKDDTIDYNDYILGPVYCSKGTRFPDSQRKFEIQIGFTGTGEINESPKQIVDREMKEELGLKLTKDAELYRIYKSHNKALKMVNHTYIISVNDLENLKKEDLEKDIDIHSKKVCVDSNPFDILDTRSTQSGNKIKVGCLAYGTKRDVSKLMKLNSDEEMYHTFTTDKIIGIGAIKVSYVLHMIQNNYFFDMNEFLCVLDNKIGN